MKYGKKSLFFFKKLMTDLDKRRMNSFTIDDHFKKKVDIPYIDDGNNLHKFDIYYADDYMKKGICVIYIHGGSFIFGSRKNAEYYKEIFLNQVATIAIPMQTTGMTVDSRPTDRPMMTLVAGPDLDWSAMVLTGLWSPV